MLNSRGLKLVRLAVEANKTRESLEISSGESDVCDDSDDDPTVLEKDLNCSSSSGSSSSVSANVNHPVEENSDAQPLVPIEDSELGQERGKKRIRNEQEWTRNRNKKLRNEGKRYTNVKGKVVAEKSFRNF